MSTTETSNMKQPIDRLYTALAETVTAVCLADPGTYDISEALTVLVETAPQVSEEAREEALDLADRIVADITPHEQFSSHCDDEEQTREHPGQYGVCRYCLLKTFLVYYHKHQPN